MRKFINGRYEGTKLEIMPSKAATKLPDGTPITAYNYDEAELNATQVAHRLGNINVHARQTFHGTVPRNDAEWVIYEGPSIAQQWKAEYQAMRTQRGWTARYYNTGIDPYYEDDER